MTCLPTPALAGPRLAGLPPAHNLADFRFRAEVDWVELKIVTARPTNFQTVRERLDVPYVEAVHPGPGGAATTFVAKIQDPISWADLEARIARLETSCGLAAPAEVIAIEVALDAYSPTHDHDALVSMAERFYRGLTVLVSDNRRLYRKRGEGESIRDRRTLRSGLHKLMNVAIGDEGGSRYQHIYIKTVNQGAPIPVAEHRARIEIRLRGEQLPCKALAAWGRHKLTETMGGYFKFRAEKPCLSLLIATAIQQRAQIGERYSRRRRPSGTRMYSPSTQADRSLNDAAYEALRLLDRRMRGKR